MNTNMHVLVNISLFFFSHVVIEFLPCFTVQNIKQYDTKSQPLYQWKKKTHLWGTYAGQEATVRTGHGTTDWFQIGKGVCQGCILFPAYLTYMQSTS